jgi:hypothetical protein
MHGKVEGALHVAILRLLLFLAERQLIPFAFSVAITD